MFPIRWIRARRTFGSTLKFSTGYKTPNRIRDHTRAQQAKLLSARYEILWGEGCKFLCPAAFSEHICILIASERHCITILHHREAVPWAGCHSDVMATEEYEFPRIITKDFVFDAARLNANLFTVLQLVRGKGLTGRGPRVTEFYCIHRHIFI